MDGLSGEKKVERRGGERRWREEVEVDNGGSIWYKKNVVRGRGNNGVFI